MRREGCKANKQSKLMKIVCLPIRILSNARYFYMKSIENCAGRVGSGGGGIVCHAPPSPSRLPKIFSVNSAKASDDEELRKLLRAVSMGGIDSKVGQRMQRQPSGMKQSSAGCGGMGMRSYSVGIGKIGRIDEDKPCSFEEEEIDTMADFMYPRIRSRAVRRNFVGYR